MIFESAERIVSHRGGLWWGGKMLTETSQVYRYTEFELFSSEYCRCGTMTVPVTKFPKNKEMDNEKRDGWPSLKQP
jgi:hypothetical protein